METQEQNLKNKVKAQNEKLKECLKVSSETVAVSNETNKELFQQGG